MLDLYMRRHHGSTDRPENLATVKHNKVVCEEDQGKLSIKENPQQQFQDRFLNFSAETLPQPARSAESYNQADTLIKRRVLSATTMVPTVHATQPAHPDTWSLKFMYLKLRPKTVFISFLKSTLALKTLITGLTFCQDYYIFSHGTFSVSQKFESHADIFTV